MNTIAALIRIVIGMNTATVPASISNLRRTDCGTMPPTIPLPYGCPQAAFWMHRSVNPRDAPGYNRPSVRGKTMRTLVRIIAGLVAAHLYIGAAAAETPQAVKAGELVVEPPT